VTLRARLTAWLALFAVLPLLLVFAPVSILLRQSLEREQAARLEAAVRAIDAELQRLSQGASDGTRDLAALPEVAELARALTAGGLPPPEASATLAALAATRGLDVAWIGEAGGQVAAAAHLPGRAGDVDAALAGLLAAAAGAALPVRLERAGAGELERAVALVAWQPLGAGGLRLAGGVALTPEVLARLAQLAGGDALLRDAEGTAMAEAATPVPGPGRRGRAPTWIIGALAGATRTLPLGPPAAPAGSLELHLASAGLLSAWVGVLVAFLVLAAMAVAGAALLGRWVASRQTAPIEALRAAAARVAAGDLSARVGAVPGGGAGEVDQLVRDFDAMTAELESGRARLAASERVAAWREVARALAHELKNPLTPIAMSVELLRDARGRPDFGEILDESTRAIGEEVRRLRRIVDEFSRFARLPAPALAAVPAGELAEALLALYPAPPGVELVRAIEPGLPAVQADRDQILQVLLNLVQNALEAMPRGGRLELSARRAGEEVIFEVADDGSGIPAELLPRIFEPYVTTKAGGTGLGLAIAERIVVEHGGRIEASSPPGQGARFSVRLPVRAVWQRATDRRAT